MNRFVASGLLLLFLAVPAVADDAACEQAGRQLHSRTKQCLSSAMHDTCIDQAIGYYANTVRKIEGGCDDTGSALKDCLVDALKTDRNDKGLVENCLATHAYD